MSNKVLFRRRWLWWGFVVIATIAGAYYFLGGFNALQIETVAVSNYYLVGKSFEGTYKSDTLQEYFTLMKSHLQEKTYEGRLAVIYDQEPQGSKGYIKSFIGIVLSKELHQIPRNLETRNITCSEAVRVWKDCHSSLMPNPHEITRLITDNLGDRPAYQFSIEMYYPDNRLVVERPLLP